MTNAPNRPSDMAPLVVNAEGYTPNVKRKGRSARQTLNDYGDTILYGPWRTPNRRWISASILSTLAITAAIVAFIATRPVRKPDFETGALDRIFAYTLLTKEFNNLPIEERLELLGMIVQRMKSMDASDSVLLAGFAAGIQGKAREQLLENASRLMIDAADMIATDYTDIPPDNRAAFLDDAFIRLTEIGEAITGETSKKPRAEILADAKAQAGKDQERMRDNPVSMRESARMFQFMDGDMGQHATPQQRGRISVFMRDMVRHLRGQDIATGKPKGGG